jgi:hypothetical protein
MSKDPLPRVEWDFDAVPNSELVGCCYWEYARESPFIRSLRQRCLENWRSGGPRDEKLYADTDKLQRIGYASEVIIRGFYFAPDDQHKDRHPDAPRITGSFPKAWQTLSPDERACRAKIRTNRTVIPLVPFQRGDWHDARDIAEWAEARWSEIDAAYSRVRRANPDLSEATLIERGKLQPLPGIPASLFWESGKEVTVAAIRWADFSNDEIVQCFRRWVKKARPQNLRPPDRRGHKPNDWRANLTRLAVMRLLSRFTALEITDPRQNQMPTVWETKQFARRKWGDVTKWHDARREAEKLFRKLFPFLPKDEKPRSWKRQQPAK